uniref:(California timema) hypothetical protein n=1 Tax=Timema californicum TaxID=61474 RepID=A0A7R9P6G6_TIMCA|nr:unnamed protein product [Timema californicum]
MVCKPLFFKEPHCNLVGMNNTLPYPQCCPHYDCAKDWPADDWDSGAINSAGSIEGSFPKMISHSPFTRMLGRKMNTSGLMQAIEIVSSSLQRLRENDEFLLIWGEANKIIVTNNLQPLSLPRQKKPPMRYTSPATAFTSTSVEDYLHHEYFAIIDTAVGGLKSRFDQEGLDHMRKLERSLLKGEINPVLKMYPEINEKDFEIEQNMFFRLSAPTCVEDALTAFRRLSPETQTIRVELDHRRQAELEVQISVGGTFYPTPRQTVIRRGSCCWFRKVKSSPTDRGSRQCNLFVLCRGDVRKVRSEGKVKSGLTAVIHSQMLGGHTLCYVAVRKTLKLVLVTQHGRRQGNKTNPLSVQEAIVVPTVTLTIFLNTWLAIPVTAYMVDKTYYFLPYEHGKLKNDTKGFRMNQKGTSEDCNFTPPYGLKIYSTVPASKGRQVTSLHDIPFADNAWRSEAMTTILNCFRHAVHGIGRSSRGIAIEVAARNSLDRRLA